MRRIRSQFLRPVFRLGSVVVGLVALAVLAVVLLVPAVASAVPKGGVATIGGPATGTTGGLFNNPRGVAVNQSGAGGVAAGTVYVADSTNHRIQRLNPDGSFDSLWGQDVNSTLVGTGFEICTAASGNTCKIGITTAQTGGALNLPQAVAVDQLDGSVYVVDQGNRRVQKFTATGTFVWAAGWDVVSTGLGNDATGTANQFETCVAADLDVCKIAAAAGANAGQFAAAATGIAVNPADGRVIVADGTNRRIQKLSSAGTFVSAIGYDVIPTGQAGDTGVALESCPTGAAQVTGGCQAGQTTEGGTNPGQFSNNQPTSVATDSGGAIYAIDGSRVQKLTPSGSAASILAPAQLSGAPAATRVAVDQSDHVYVVKGTTGVLEFDGAGNLVETHAPNVGLPAASGIDIRSPGGKLYYATLTNHRIIVLDAPVAPVVNLDDITVFDDTTATFSGTINPTGFATAYRFEYRRDDHPGWTNLPASDVDSGPINTTNPISQNATGLEPNSPYHVRIVATKQFGGGSAIAGPVSFVTATQAPVISGVGPNSITDSSVRLNGFIDPNRSATSYHFEYVEDGEFQESGFLEAIKVPAADGDAGSGADALPVSHPVTGLEPETTYRFRLLASNGIGGEQVSGTQTFVTRSAAESTPLPERAYELVSASDINGIESNPGVASLDGDHYVYSTDIPAPGAKNGHLGTYFRASRLPNGNWTQEAIGAPPPPPGSAVQSIAPPQYSADLSVAAFSTLMGVDPDDQNQNALDAYRDDTANDLVWLSRNPAVPAGTPQQELEAAGNDILHVSNDGGRVLFSSQRNLLSSDPTSGSSQALYQWNNAQQTTEDELQSFTVTGTVGAFGLEFNGQSTRPFPFDASAAMIEEALEALPSIGGLPGPGSVEVTGGPGDATGSNPYLVAFGGSMAGNDVSQITPSPAASVGVGQTLSCAVGPESATTKNIQWLRNGEPIAGATAAAYETVGSDAGTVIQCQGFASNANAGSTQISVPPRLVATSVPGIVPPIPPVSIAQPTQSASLTVGGAGGQELTCNAGTTWTGNPISYTYQWYRNGVSIGLPATTTATSSTYVVQAADLSTAAAFQCAVMASNSGGASRLVSSKRDTVPAPSPAAPVATSTVTAPPPPVVVASTINQGVPKHLSLVSIPPGQNSGFATGSGLGSSSGTTNSQQVTRNAVSPDGSRIVFQSGPAANTQRLYIRLDGQSTIEVSASTVDSTPLRVGYWGADRDVESIFFTSTSPLTSDSTAPDTGSGAADLFRYDVSEGELTDLTPFPGGADVTRVLAVSDDGHRIYFTSSNELEGQGVPGGPNIYVAQLGDGEDPVTLDFIATATVDLGTTPRPAWRQLAASSTGSVFAFRSSDPLVPGLRTGGLPQVFVYDAARKELTCPSCPRDGTTPSGLASLISTAPDDSPSNQTGGGISPLGPHLVSVSDGGHVFFQTASTLLPEDTNEGLIDVYEYRSGMLGLITDGQGSRDTIFGGASSDGATVFFVSGGSHAPGAESGFEHIYAARIGGGVSPVTPAPPCTGDDCRDAISGPPPERVAGGAALGGFGNASPGARPVLMVGGLSRRTRARAARSGVLLVRVRANRAGIVRLLARARLGKRVRRVAGKSVRLRSAGAVTVKLRLSGRARAAIREGKTLRVTLQGTAPGARARTSTVLLKAGGRS